MTGLETLHGLPTTRSAGSPPSVRATALFDAAPHGIALPLNRKTTRNVITEIPLAGLEPRQDSVTVQGLEAYMRTPRRDPPDVAHVIMRDGRERWLIQEGHTRLGAAILHGQTSLPVRVWEFQQADDGTFVPVVRGRHRIGIGRRARSLAGDKADIKLPDITWTVEPINLPDISSVQFPSTIGQVDPPKPTKKKRRRVKYQGVTLSRPPLEFERKVLALAEIPPRLDLAVTDLLNDAPLIRVVRDVAEYGAQQALQELVRQGAPDTILTRMPDLRGAIVGLCDRIAADRDRDLFSTRSEFETRVSRRSLSLPRRNVLLQTLMAQRRPGLLLRTAKRAVNEAFALSRTLVIAQFRRPRIDLAYQGDDGQFISTAEALSQGIIFVDAVFQSAVMDSNTCEECEAVDGEQMELGDDRQQELHPPYVLCLGGSRCRCVQIALLSDGKEINVDEVPDDVLDNE